MVDLAPVSDGTRGLEGVLAAVSSISSIVDDTLTYRGFNVEELARHSSYEEVTYLLWYGELPTGPELGRFAQDLRRGRVLPARVAEMIELLPADASPMAVLRTAVSAMCLDEDSPVRASRAANADKAATLVASLPTVIAHLYRSRTGQKLIAPDPELSSSSNFLSMLFGTSPSDLQTRALEVALIAPCGSRTQCLNLRRASRRLDPDRSAQRHRRCALYPGRAIARRSRLGGDGDARDDW